MIRFDIILLILANTLVVGIPNDKIPIDICYQLSETMRMLIDKSFSRVLVIIQLLIENPLINQILMTSLDLSIVDNK